MGSEMCIRDSAGTGLPEVREDLKRREEERDAEVAAELAAAARQ